MRLFHSLHYLSERCNKWVKGFSPSYSLLCRNDEFPTLRMHICPNPSGWKTRTLCNSVIPQRIVLCRLTHRMWCNVISHKQHAEANSLARCLNKSFRLISPLPDSQRWVALVWVSRGHFSHSDIPFVFVGCLSSRRARCFADYVQITSPKAPHRATFWVLDSTFGWYYPRVEMTYSPKN